MKKGHLLAEGDDLWENPPVYRLNKISPPDLDSLQKKSKKYNTQSNCFLFCSENLLLNICFFCPNTCITFQRYPWGIVFYAKTMVNSLWDLWAYQSVVSFSERNNIVCSWLLARGFKYFSSNQNHDNLPIIQILCSSENGKTPVPMTVMSPPT